MAAPGQCPAASDNAPAVRRRLRERVRGTYPPASLGGARPGPSGEPGVRSTNITGDEAAGT